MRCKMCQYSLEGLTEHRCPECGGAFDPADPTTFDAAPASSPKHHSITTRLFIFGLLSLGFFLVFFSCLPTPADLGVGRMPSRLSYVVPAALIASGATTFVMWVCWLDRRRQSRKDG